MTKMLKFSSVEFACSRDACIGFVWWLSNFLTLSKNTEIGWQPVQVWIPPFVQRSAPGYILNPKRTRIVENGWMDKLHSCLTLLQVAPDKVEHLCVTSQGHVSYVAVCKFKTKVPICVNGPHSLIE